MIALQEKLNEGPLGSVPLLTRHDLTTSYSFILETMKALAPSSGPGLADYDRELGVNFLHPAGRTLLEALVLYTDQVLEALWVRHRDTGDINDGVHREVRRVLTVKLLLEEWLALPRSAEASTKPELWDYFGAVEDLLEPVASEAVEW